MSIEEIEGTTHLQAAVVGRVRVVSHPEGSAILYDPYRFKAANILGTTTVVERQPLAPGAALTTVTVRWTPQPIAPIEPTPPSRPSFWAPLKALLGRGTPPQSSSPTRPNHTHQITSTHGLIECQNLGHFDTTIPAGDTEPVVTIRVPQHLATLRIEYSS